MNKAFASANQRSWLSFERLEDRRLLAAVIHWANSDLEENDFNAVYGPNAQVAAANVYRAISDWQQVITSFNYTESDNLNETFTLNISAATNVSLAKTDGLDQTPLGIPYGADIELDDNALGKGWYFDSTPSDDAEFSAIAGPNAANFIDATASGSVDFYRVVLHEIGHALGFSDGLQRFRDLETDIVDDPRSSEPSDFLRVFTFGNETAILESFLTIGPHLYNDPEVEENGVVIVQSHPNQLMNTGAEVLRERPPGVPAETTRQWISDLEVKILAAAFGYSVNLPSTLNSAHTTFDPISGTLLVQGLPGAVNDEIDITIEGDNIKVVVNGHTETALLAEVTQIVIAGHGGVGDDIYVAPALTPLRRDVDYVVSSNEDNIDSGSVNDGIADLDDIVPGHQTTLRAAIRDIDTGAGRIFIPRGKYELSLAGSDDIAEGDLDVAGEVTVIGAGAGITFLQTEDQFSDRHFEVGTTGELTLRRMTLTGGNEGVGGSINVANDASPGQTALTLDEVAVVHNTSSMVGGAIHVGSDAKALIKRSVITNDTASAAGGGIAANDGAEVTLEGSIVAKNSAMYYPDLAISGSGMFISAGYNLIGDIGNSGFTLGTGDHESDPETAYHVVTTLLDTFDHSDNEVSLSLREAIHLANTNDNELEEIWLPAWNFILTRDRATYGVGSFTDTDTDITFGDLDISDSLIFRGAGGGLATVGWQDEVEAVFDLQGDYNGSGWVGAPDFLMWQQQHNSSGAPNEFSADGDDDGDVDGDDRDIWDESYGNTLNLIGVTLS